ncbi:MAG TPA: hypothetical protein VJ103_02265 [Candidatus Paceibacterota bacterium]|nr:hypothetical protein [Candidatus Paceibacterota bacterium]
MINELCIKIYRDTVNKNQVTLLAYDDGHAFKDAFLTAEAKITNDAEIRILGVYFRQNRGFDSKKCAPEYLEKIEIAVEKMIRCWNIVYQIT